MIRRIERRLTGAKRHLHKFAAALAGLILGSLVGRMLLFWLAITLHAA